MVTYRPFQNSDRQALYYINEEIFSEQRPVMPFTIIAEEEGRVIGYVTAKPIKKGNSEGVLENDLYVGVIAVNESRREEGIGETLLQKVINQYLLWAKETQTRNHFNAYAHIHEKNWPSIELFTSGGFVKERLSDVRYRSENFMGEGQAYLMKKTLP